MNKNRSDTFFNNFMIIFKGYSIQTSFVLQICPSFEDALYKTLIIIKMQQCITTNPS